MAEPSENQDPEPPNTCIVINERPLLVWDLDYRRSQLGFRESIDPGYFVHVAKINEPHLDGEDSLYAAAAIRLAYSHALETLFAFIGAAIQSPSCPAGWLLEYKVFELHSLVEKIETRGSAPNSLYLDRLGWRLVTDKLLPF